MIKLFKKSPIPVEAIQIEHNEVLARIARFCAPRVTKSFMSKENKLVVVIETLEGDHKATVGDWVIKGIKGECYPCREDIFNETYEEVEL